MRIKTITAALALSVAGLATSSPSFAADAEYTFKLHHMLPPMAMPHAEFLAPWAEKIEQESGGRIDIEIFPAMQLGGKPPQLFDQARKGIVDISWTVGGYTPGRFPKATAFELPFIPASAEATSMALQEYAETEMGDELSDVHLLAMHTHAPGSLHSREKPIQTGADLDGTNFRAPNKVMAEAFSPYGTNSVFMPVTQMASAVSKGVLDIAVLPFEVVASMKIHQLVDHHTEIPGDRGLYTQFFIFSMNKDSYESLPPDLQKVIDDNSGIELAGHIGSLFDKYEGIAREEAVKEGNSFYELSMEERNSWEETMQPAIQEWMEQMSDDGYDAEGLYRKAQTLIEKYTQQVNQS
ncbi:TRAP transporter substrate-binding protein [Marinobacterium lutimaris]|uniref:TRAP-type C4-dicarboxylate transport system, substrate-binding protein n=1 Tax=Marinobacterium lutimaris TaxID=568106 RepID=A0A1H5T8U7_9GAMM|nr:TRAP transporter substrate-binding protein [Marinobacterium lutimaris]SEF59282.1 TRAP-type C4-dicarboxylate transport system, substrate-binding protein [Marinobacterium lutimaris]